MATAPSPPDPGRDWCFFLDVDGTLIEIAPTPEGVHVDADVVDLLRRLHAHAGGALALVSGRPIAQLDELFAPLKLPAAGLHGLEIRSDGGIHKPVEAPDAPAQMRKALAEFAAARSGVRFEDKGRTIALHYRQAPDAADACRAAVDEVVRDHGAGYHVLKGKMVFEIRPDGTHKGRVVADFMAAPPFSGRTPAFIGDDVTDEDGFDAVNRMGGHSVRVGNGVTRARYRIADVAGLRRWLARAADATTETK